MGSALDRVLSCSRQSPPSRLCLSGLLQDPRKKKWVGTAFQAQEDSLPKVQGSLRNQTSQAGVQRSSPLVMEWQASSVSGPVLTKQSGTQRRGRGCEGAALSGLTIRWHR